jgi:hypothetical protein
MNENQSESRDELPKQKEGDGNDGAECLRILCLKKSGPAKDRGNEVLEKSHLSRSNQATNCPSSLNSNGRPTAELCMKKALEPQ